MSKSKKQQLQFFYDCLFSDNCIGGKPDGLDFKALVDCSLEVGEYWRNNIKPVLELLESSEDKWDSVSKDFVNNEIEKYRNMADKRDDVVFEGDLVEP